MGNKDVEVDSLLSKEDYLSGKPFMRITSTKTHPLYTFQPKKFVPPTLTKTLPEYRTALVKPKVHGPRHDPNAPDAMILPSPQMPIGIKAIDVVLDPILIRCLRPHQKDGMKFLYECVMGIKEFNGRGAILADEMGLGKTLTVIALIWTLLSTISSCGTKIRTKSLSGGNGRCEKGSRGLSVNSHYSISHLCNFNHRIGETSSKSGWAKNV